MPQISPDSESDPSKSTFLVFLTVLSFLPQNMLMITAFLWNMLLYCLQLIDTLQVLVYTCRWWQLSWLLPGLPKDCFSCLLLCHKSSQNFLSVLRAASVRHGGLDLGLEDLSPRGHSFGLQVVSWDLSQAREPGASLHGMCFLRAVVAGFQGWASQKRRPSRSNIIF